MFREKYCMNLMGLNMDMSTNFDSMLQVVALLREKDCITLLEFSMDMSTIV